jgi:hypothetical protein
MREVQYADFCAVQVVWVLPLLGVSDARDRVKCGHGMGNLLLWRASSESSNPN